MVVISPTCPPDSVPSAMTASTPRRSIRWARATLATTGITLMPASLRAGTYLPGLPAPVVTTGTFFSMDDLHELVHLRMLSMMLTPKGLGR